MLRNLQRQGALLTGRGSVRCVHTPYVVSIMPPPKDIKEESRESGVRQKTTDITPLAAAAAPLMIHSASQPMLSPTVIWWLESCVGVGSIKMGLPGIAAQFVFLAPMQAMTAIQKDKTTGKLPLLPYSAMAVNGAIWMTYGFLCSNPAIWGPNVPALLLGSYYTYTFSKYVPKNANWLPGTMSNHYMAIAGATASAVGVAMALPTETAATVVGLAGDAIAVAMFTGPLAAISTVMKEKSTRSLPFAFTVAAFTNCSLWTLYGVFAINDPIVYVPNILGLGSSVFQLSLFARFGFDDGKKKIAEDSKV